MVVHRSRKSIVDAIAILFVAKVVLASDISRRSNLDLDGSVEIELVAEHIYLALVSRSVDRRGRLTVIIANGVDRPNNKLNVLRVGNILVIRMASHRIVSECCFVELMTFDGES